MAERGRDGFRRVLGIMSGTSLDGVDCVLTRFDDDGRPKWARGWGRAYPAALRRRVEACASGKAGVWECGQLHHDLGRFYAAVACAGLAGDVIEAVGLHGQTVFHRGEAAATATLQIGEPAQLACALRVPVVSNFRAADMAVGGQGAPMATLFHLRLFGEAGRHVCVQNLGGIGNVTSIDARRGAPVVRSFDTGPGNMLVDGAVRRISGGRRSMDRFGRGAAAGRVEEGLLRGWLGDAFIRRKPPKSTGRERFGEAYLDARWGEMDRLGLEPNDRLATLTEYTARSVALNYRLHLGSAPDEVILCGGGARNDWLVARLAVAMAREFASSPVRVDTSEARGWPVEAVEGGAFALLARERLLGRPGNVPETTGAARAVCCGVVSGW